MIIPFQNTIKVENNLIEKYFENSPKSFLKIEYFLCFKAQGEGGCEGEAEVQIEGQTEVQTEVASLHNLEDKVEVKFPFLRLISSNLEN